MIKKTNKLLLDSVCRLSALNREMVECAFGAKAKSRSKEGVAFQISSIGQSSGVPFSVILISRPPIIAS
jgi:hypothetical protein